MLILIRFVFRIWLIGRLISENFQNFDFGVISKKITKIIRVRSDKKKTSGHDCTYMKIKSRELYKGVYFLDKREKSKYQNWKDHIHSWKWTWDILCLDLISLYQSLFGQDILTPDNSMAKSNSDWLSGFVIIKFSVTCFQVTRKLIKMTVAPLMNYGRNCLQSFLKLRIL